MDENEGKTYKRYWQTSLTGNYHLIKPKAKENRSKPTIAEERLWQYLRGSKTGYKFRFQHPIGEYIVDFVCLKKHLVIEVDGGYHDLPDQIELDIQRTQFLNNNGFQVIRFTNQEIIDDTDSVVTKIIEYMNNDINKPCPSKSSLQSEINGSKSPLQLEGKGEVGPSKSPLQLEGMGEVSPSKSVGRLLIISAPSGSGKSTIVHWLMDNYPELKLRFSVSATSREPRCNNGKMEVDGVDYYFLTPDEFRKMIAEGAFLEYEEVYEGRFYGTPKKQVDDKLSAGYNVVFDVDVKGGINIKKYFGEKALSIFIQPPSIDVLRQRLEGRGSDSPEEIENRLAKAEYEMTFAPQFDHIVTNDVLEDAEAETLELVKGFLK